MMFRWRRVAMLTAALAATMVALALLRRYRLRPMHPPEQRCTLWTGEQWAAAVSAEPGRPDAGAMGRAVDAIGFGATAAAPAVMCLPSLLIAGTPKSGSTSLYWAAIMTHPQLRPMRLKEPGLFNGKHEYCAPKHKRSCLLAHAGPLGPADATNSPVSRAVLGPIAWTNEALEDHFDAIITMHKSPSSDARAQLCRDRRALRSTPHPHPHHAVDATVTYSLCPHTPARIHALLGPSARIALLVREPIARLVSHFNMNAAGNAALECRSIDTAIDEAFKYIDRCRALHRTEEDGQSQSEVEARHAGETLADCLADEGGSCIGFRRPQSALLLWGVYDRLIDLWTTANALSTSGRPTKRPLFDRSALHFVSTDDLRLAPEAVMAELFAFWRLDPALSAAAVPLAAALLRDTHALAAIQPIGPASPAAVHRPSADRVDRLRAFFAPSLERFANLTGIRFKHPFTKSGGK